MARPGQIVYNLQDYQQSGGRISTSGSNVFATIVDTDPGYKANRINIYENVVSHYDGQRFQKVGIQAAPGTQFILNGTKGMIVGRNGIYELDEDIVITELSFVKPRNYVLDQDQTTQKLNAGIKALTTAENVRKTDLANLDKKYEIKDLLVDEATLSADGSKYIYPNSIYTNWKDVYPQLFETYSDNGDGTFSVDKTAIDNALVQLNKDYWEEYTNVQNTYQATYQDAQDDLTLGLNGVYRIDNTTEGDLDNVIIDFLY